MAHIPFSMPFKAPHNYSLIKVAEEHFDFGGARAEARGAPLNDLRSVSVKIIQPAEKPSPLTRWLWNPLKVTSALVTFLMFVIKALFRHNTRLVIANSTKEEILTWCRNHFQLTDYEAFQKDNIGVGGDCLASFIGPDRRRWNLFKEMNDNRTAITHFTLSSIDPIEKNDPETIATLTCEEGLSLLRLLPSQRRPITTSLSAFLASSS